MKFFHLGDLHLGKRVNEFSMLEDQRYILDKIISAAAEQKPDFVIIAGDVYDKSVPPSEAVTLLDYFLTSLRESGTEIFIISGNHDSAERLSFGSSIISGAGVHIAPVFDGTVSKAVINDEYGRVNIYLLPFIKPANVCAVYGIERQLTYSEAVAEVLAGIELNLEDRNIIAAHQFVTGALRSESEEISVGGLDNVDVDVFADFDYVALGHIHRPQKISRETVRYSGTPLKYAFSEAGHEKSITVVHLANKGDIKIDFVPLTPLRDLKEIKGKYLELTDASFYKNLDLQNYYHITLTDENDILDAMAKLGAIYPNIMKLDYERDLLMPQDAAIDAVTADTKSPLELFELLYVRQTGREMNAAQTEYMKDMIEDIWE